MGKPLRLALSALLFACASSARADEPANTLQSLFVVLNRCLSTVRLAKGADVTVQFMLNRRGGLIGKPRLTHAYWGGDDSSRQSSAASIAEGFDHCLPAAITDALGGAIAGRLIAYRFHTPETPERRS